MKKLDMTTNLKDANNQEEKMKNSNHIKFNNLKGVII